MSSLFRVKDNGRGSLSYGNHPYFLSTSLPFGYLLMENFWHEIGSLMFLVNRVLYDESVNHLVFNCSVSKNIWNGIRKWLGMRKLMGIVAAVLEAFRHVYRGTSNLAKLRCSALAACIYHIWNARNRSLFEQESPIIEDIIKKIKIILFRCMSSFIDIFDVMFWI